MLVKERMNRIMEKASTDQLLITDPYAVYYLTGKWIFPGERFLGLLLKRGEEPVLFVNELFRFEEELGVKKAYYADTDDVISIVKKETEKNAAIRRG